MEMALVCLLKRNKRIKIEKIRKKKNFFGNRERTALEMERKQKNYPSHSIRSTFYRYERHWVCRFDCFRSNNRLILMKSRQFRIFTMIMEKGDRVVWRRILPLDDPNATICWYRFRVGTNSYRLSVFIVRRSGNCRRRRQRHVITMMVMTKRNFGENDVSSSAGWSEHYKLLVSASSGYR